MACGAAALAVVHLLFAATALPTSNVHFLEKGAGR